MPCAGLGQPTLAFMDFIVQAAPAQTAVHLMLSLSVARARGFVAEALGVDTAAAEEVHPAAPWRHRLLAALVDRMHDSDSVAPDWLRDGAPMGLACPIAVGGHFPLLTDPPASSTDQLTP